MGIFGIIFFPHCLSVHMLDTQPFLFIYPFIYFDCHFDTLFFGLYISFIYYFIIYLFIIIVVKPKKIQFSKKW